MSGHFFLELDTTPPSVVEWGDPGQLSQGNAFSFEVTLTEPGIEAALLRDSSSNEVELDVDGFGITGVVPNDFTEGAGLILLHLVDEVGNEVWESHPALIGSAQTSVELELDTTPPVITWGIATGLAPESSFSIEYTINEPAIVSAYLQDGNNQVIPLAVNPDSLTAILPANTAGGPATVYAEVVDDVLNAATRSIVIVLEGELPVSEQDSGGGQQFTHIGGPAFVKETDRFSAESDAVIAETENFAGIVSARHTTQTETLSFSAQVAAARLELQAFEGSREANLHFAQLRNEDEELLLLV